MVNSTKKEKCYVCENVHYLKAYAESGKFIICSRRCWEEYKVRAAKKKAHEQHQIH